MSAYAPHKYNPWEMAPEELEATFIGRQPLLDRLLEAVREQSQAESIQHYILLGPRGIGKTTLLLLLRRRLKRDPDLAARWLCVHYREEEYYVYTLRDLLALALESLHADEGVAEAKAVLDEAQAEPDDEKSQAILLSGLRRISEARGQRFLLLVDNLDQFLRGLPKRDETETFQHALRKLLSTEHFLMLIGTSTRHFEEFASYDEAFFNFFCPITVGNLSDDEVDALLLARACFDDNHDFVRDYEQHKANIRTITFLIGGNPRFVLMLYEILSQQRILPVVHALRQTVDNLTPLFKDVLEQMSRQQSKTLDAIMRLGGAGSPTDIASTARLALNVVTTMLGRLRDAGFLASEGEGKGRPATYRVRDQMFRTWYQMRYLRPNRRRLELLADFLRAWFTAAEREATIEHLHGEFQKELADGLTHHARETALTMEYYAASLEQCDSRRRHMEQVAENYFVVGDPHQAALTMAEASGIVAESHARYQTAGLVDLGNRLLDRQDYERAAQSFRQALLKDGSSVPAKIGLGYCLTELGDHHAAEHELSAVIAMPQAPAYQRAFALLFRGRAKAGQGDVEGGAGDYTAAEKLPGAPPEAVAFAILARGKAKLQTAHMAGALADFTAAAELPGALPDQVVDALLNRGVSYGDSGDNSTALRDFDAAVNVAGASKSQTLLATLMRGFAQKKLGNTGAAIGDFAFCLEGRPKEATLGVAIKALSSELATAGRGGEILQWVSRLDELEPSGAPTEDRVLVRIAVLGRMADHLSLDAASEALEIMMKTPDAALRERLAFLVPALELARTGDEGVLAKLPEAEREAARRIAATLAKSRQEG
jgi:tetratricopeptide (TPR) repeat protein